MKASFRLVNSKRIDGVLNQLRALGENMEPVMQDIAVLGESQTRMHFRTQTDPHGSPWEPSIRALATGGRTLVKDRHLLDSISHGFSSQHAEWGANRVYAAIQNFGGMAGPGRKVEIEGREYLGLGQEEEQDMFDVLLRHVDKASEMRGSDVI